MDAISNINSFQLPVAPPAAGNRVERDVVPDPNRVQPASESRTTGRSDDRKSASDLPEPVPASQAGGPSVAVPAQGAGPRPPSIEADNPVAGPSPRKSVFERLMELEASTDASATLKDTGAETAGAEKSAQFVDTLSDVRAAPKAEETSFYVPPRPAEAGASTTAAPSQAADPNSAERRAADNEARDNERTDTVA